jgi:transposase-like protein
VLETLASDDMEALRESVLANGILVHVIIDRDGNVIDGHHRVHLAVDNDLPIPFMVVDLQTDEEKRALAWELNRARRQMSAEQKAQIRWQKVVVEGLPIAQVAKELGESHDTTLRNVRKQAEADASSAAANGESPEPVEVLTPSERQRQTVIEALKATPEKSDRQIAKDTGASQPTVSRLRKKAAAATDPKKEVVKNKTAPKPTIHDDFAKAVAKLSKAADEVVRLSKDQRASRSSAKLWESHSQEMVAIMNGLKDLSLKLSGKTK